MLLYFELKLTPFQRICHPLASDWGFAIPAMFPKRFHVGSFCLQR